MISYALEVAAAIFRRAIFKTRIKVLTLARSTINVTTTPYNITALHASIITRPSSRPAAIDGVEETPIYLQEEKQHDIIIHLCMCSMHNSKDDASQGIDLNRFPSRLVCGLGGTVRVGCPNNTMEHNPANQTMTPMRKIHSKLEFK
jgi:hypothetical protein